MSFDPVCPGGCLEIKALSSALGQKICEIDVDSEDSLEERGPKLFSPDDLHVLDGVCEGEHFDAVYHPGRIPPSVQSEMKDPSRTFIPFDRLPGANLDQDSEGDEPPSKYRKVDPWNESLPLGELVPVEEIGPLLPQDHRCKDIQELSGCCMIKILSDGHCLFRSLSVLLMAKKAVLDALLARSEELQPFAPPGVQLRKLFTKTKDMIDKGFLPGRIVRDKDDFSESWILFLRHAAINYWLGEFEKNPLGGVEALLDAERNSFRIDDNDLAMAHYVSTMGSTSRWGDQSEIVAIQNALSIPPIRVIDLTIPKARRVGGLLPIEGADANGFYILRSPDPDHYDALFIPGQFKKTAPSASRV
jgi:hypothetical protein